MKSIKLLLIAFLFSLASISQNDSATKAVGTIPTSQEVNETVMKYEQFLRQEAEQHRAYTQEYYTTILKLLGALAIIIGGVLTWMNWNSTDRIKKVVNDKFESTVQDELELRVRDETRKIEKKFIELDKRILEISSTLNPDQKDTKGKMVQNAAVSISDLKGKKILWVDDYPENNEYAINALKQQDVVFNFSKDTESAVQAVKKTKYDLIISDMGRGDNASAGIDLIKKLKEDLKLTVPILIFASSEAVARYGAEALKLGAVSATSSVTRALGSIQQILSGNYSPEFSIS